ncbi:MAG TPA: carboxypeptidase-like regulatory domain-containing protein [Pyrinomonadaceae bacterium]|nr:carboxypeptidase-like regulatory domain-containing protein [Pyrinomonadaceae bacterium]
MKFFRFTLFSVIIFAFSALAFAQDSGSVKGKVRTTSGDGISEVTVIARQKGEDIKSVTTDAKGNFVMSGLKTGLYNLVFTKSGYGQGVLYNIEVKNKKETDLGSRLILTLDQGTLVLIKGSVFNQDGVSLFGVKIEIERINSDGSTKKVGTIYSSESGEFTFKFPKGAAKYRITASAKGVSASKDVEVEDAAIYRLAITLNMKNGK